MSTLISMASVSLSGKLIKLAADLLFDKLLYLFESRWDLDVSIIF